MTEHVQPKPVRPASSATTRMLVLIGVLAAAVLVTGYFALNANADRAALRSHSVRSAADIVRANPNDIGARLQYAYALQNTGASSKALAQYKRVLQKQPENTAALYNSGLIQLTSGRGKEGEKLLRQVLTIDSGHVLAAQTLGRWYVHERRFTDAVAILEPVAHKQQEIADLRYLLGSAYEGAGRNDKAVAEYKAALRYTPDYTPASTALARMQGGAK